jgi:hypothetical protein
VGPKGPLRFLDLDIKKKKKCIEKKKKTILPPAASSSIFNMDLGPNVVRIMSATACPSYKLNKTKIEKNKIK